MTINRLKYSKNIRSSSRSNLRMKPRRNGGHHRINNFSDGGTNKSKIRGNPSQVLNRYLVLAKNALSVGDRIQAEYYFQHADHFSRIMSENFDKSEKNKDPEINLDINEDIKDEKSYETKTDDGIKNDEKEVDESSLDSVSFLSNPNIK